jgi:hypothetical protein
MKYLKLFESYTESDIAKICEQYNIRNWSINSEGLVDVGGGVDLTLEVLNKLPLNFGHVNGDFKCSYNQLTNLEGCPRSVGGDFWCAYNELTSLEGCPKSVNGGFYCHYNNLTSLQYGPQIVGGDFYCDKNKLTSLQGGPQIVGGNFYCHNNQLTSLRFAPEEVEGGTLVLPNPISDIPERYLNEDYLQFIVKEQPDWRLYSKDGSIHPERLEQMIEWGIETNKIKPL